MEFHVSFLTPDLPICSPPCPAPLGGKEVSEGGWLPAGATPAPKVITEAAASKTALADLRASCHQINCHTVCSCPLGWG